MDTPSLDTHPLVTSSPDTSPLEATLHAAGFPVDLLTDEQRLVLGELTTEELTLLLDVKSRLDAVGPEVQAHGEIAGGALF
ncbi:aroma-sacti cluster domain-containing protein [Streptomyces bacillaris]